MKNGIRRACVALLILAGLFVLGQFLYTGFLGPSAIFVQNNSAATLSDVHVLGGGWDHPLGELKAGGRINFIQHVRGEGTVQSISFVVDGKKMAHETGMYIEESGGYCVRLTVNQDLSVTTKQIFQCFGLRRAINS